MSVCSVQRTQQKANYSTHNSFAYLHTLRDREPLIKTSMWCLGVNVSRNESLKFDVIRFKATKKKVKKKLVNDRPSIT